jgi:hypothetical protein
MPKQKEELKTNLEDALRNHCVEIESASERLTVFNSVTNTHLYICLALGGILRNE